MLHIELQIRPKLELREMVEKWPRYFEKYTHRPETDSGTFKFVYRREAMVSIEAESRIFDAAAIKLLYGEARKNIMTGRYPVPDPNEAAKLAAMHLLSTHGTYDPQKHGPGTNFIQESLQLLVPSNVVMKFKPPEWDQRILSAWSNMVKKESDIAGYKDFLDYCMQWTIYGSNFFPACKNVPPEGYFELRTDHLMIGVGRSGICIVDMDKGKVSWYGSYAGVEWECTPDSITIEYRPNTNGNGAAPKRMASTLITPQAHLIDSLASRAVYLIEKSARRPKDRRASTTKGAVIEKSSRMATEDAEAYLKAVNEARKSGM